MRGSEHQSVRNQAPPAQAADNDHKLPRIIDNVEAAYNSITRRFSANARLLSQLSDSFSFRFFDPLNGEFSAVDYLRNHVFQLEKVEKLGFSSLISRN